jgi:hypothetical protein
LPLFAQSDQSVVTIISPEGLNIDDNYDLLEFGQFGPGGINPSSLHTVV